MSQCFKIVRKNSVLDHLNKHANVQEPPRMKTMPKQLLKLKWKSLCGPPAQSYIVNCRSTKKLHAGLNYNKVQLDNQKYSQAAGVYSHTISDSLDSPSGNTVDKDTNTFKLNSCTQIEGDNYECEICFRVLKVKNMNAHLISHYGQKRFKCPECDSSFTRKSDVARHHSNVHSQTDLSCSHCNQSFTTVRSLNLHNKTHANGPYLRCPTCHFNFNKKEYYLNHITYIHPTSKTKNHALCNSIHKDSYIITDDNQETNSTTKELCLLSDFIPKSNYETLVCPACQDSFYDYMELKDHLQAHLQEFQISCKLCPSSFRDAGEFVTHIIYKHELNYIDSEVLEKLEKLKLAKGMLDNVELQLHSGKNSENSEPEMYLSLPVSRLDFSKLNGDEVDNGNSSISSLYDLTNTQLEEEKESHFEINIDDTTVSMIQNVDSLFPVVVDDETLVQTAVNCAAEESFETVAKLRLLHKVHNAASLDFDMPLGTPLQESPGKNMMDVPFQSISDARNMKVSDSLELIIGDQFEIAK